MSLILCKIKIKYYWICSSSCSTPAWSMDGRTLTSLGGDKVRKPLRLNIFKLEKRRINSWDGEYLLIYLSHRNVMVLKIEVQSTRNSGNHESRINIFNFCWCWLSYFWICEMVEVWNQNAVSKKEAFLIKNKLAIPFLLDKLTRGKWVNIFPGASWWCRPLASESGGGEAGLGQSAANTDPSSNIGRPLYMGVDGSGAEAEDSRGHGGSKDDYRTCTICSRDNVSRKKSRSFTDWILSNGFSGSDGLIPIQYLYHECFAWI